MAWTGGRAGSARLQQAPFDVAGARCGSRHFPARGQGSPPPRSVSFFPGRPTWMQCAVRPPSAATAFASYTRTARPGHALWSARPNWNLSHFVLPFGGPAHLGRKALGRQRGFSRFYASDVHAIPILLIADSLPHKQAHYPSLPTPPSGSAARSTSGQLRAGGCGDAPRRAGGRGMHARRARPPGWDAPRRELCIHAQCNAPRDLRPRDVIEQ